MASSHAARRTALRWPPKPSSQKRVDASANAYAGRTPGPALPEIEENDARWSADGRVLAGEKQAAGARIDAESGDRIASLVARVEIVARGGGIDRKSKR